MMHPTSLTAASPLYYEETGGGQPVVLLHGMGCDGRIWEEVRPELARAYRVFTPDLLGHGRSPKPWRRYRPQLYLDYLVRWLEALDVGPVHVVGHSLGGMLALLLAMERPDLVRSVAGVCPVRLVDHTPPREALRAFMRFGLALLFGAPSPGATRRLLTEGMGMPEGALTPEMVARMRESFHRSARAVRSTNGQIRRPEAVLTGRLHEVKCPVWLLWGKRDPLFPGVEEMARVAERMPEALPEFMDAGHLPMLEKPEEFLRRLMGHLERVSK